MCLIMGVFAGMCISPFNHSRQKGEVQRDTVVVYDTARYSRLELEIKRHRLDVPDITSPKVVMVPEDSTTIIYRDSVRYVTMPRQFFYTKTQDAEIWHSGIDSTIDSLNVFRKNTTITERISAKRKKHGLGVGVEATYYNTLYVPVYAEYQSFVTSWLSIYGRVGYNIPTKEYGLSLGARMQLQW